MSTPILTGVAILKQYVAEGKAEVALPKMRGKKGKLPAPVHVPVGIISDQKYSGDMFWKYMDSLHWRDTEEGKNTTRQAAGLPDNHIDDIKADAKKYAEALVKVIDESKILQSDPSYAGDRTLREMLAYHIVAKGKIMYDACIATPDICVASVGVENDLIGFLSF